MMSPKLAHFQNKWKFSSFLPLVSLYDVIVVVSPTGVREYPTFSLQVLAKSRFLETVNFNHKCCCQGIVTLVSLNHSAVKFKVDQKNSASILFSDLVRTINGILIATFWTTSCAGGRAIETWTGAGDGGRVIGCETYFGGTWNREQTINTGTYTYSSSRFQNNLVELV